MSKQKVKSVLASMDKGEIIEAVLELYSSRKEAKEWLDYFAEPDEKKKLEEYKAIIGEEFYPRKRRQAKARFSVCRKALSDFKKMKPSEEAVAELMVFYMENACEFAYDCGDMWEQYYDSVQGNFKKTLLYIVKNGLWGKYDARLKQCVDWSADCGCGFTDSMEDLYNSMKKENAELKSKKKRRS